MGRKRFQNVLMSHVNGQKGNLKSVNEGKKIKCDICDYKCSQKGNMKTHISMVHEGKKPFKCHICDYSCSLKHHIKSHVASVHERKKP